MKFSTEELKQLALEPSWLKRYCMTTGKMVISVKQSIKLRQAEEPEFVSPAVFPFPRNEKSGIVIKGEMVTNG